MTNLLKTLMFLLMLPVMVFGQKSDALQQLYNQELKTFKEAMIRSQQMNPDTNIDVKFYHLELDISLGSPFLQATSTVVLEPKTDNLEELTLNLHGSMDVDSISGPVTSFQHSSPNLTIFLDQPFNTGDEISLAIHYHGVPVLAGGYKGMRYETHGSNEPIIATLSTPFLAHYWFPCKDGPSDKPDSAFIDVIVPDTIIDDVSLKGVSNGTLEGTETVGNKKIFKWRHRYPIVTYYMMAAVSNFEIINDSYTGIYGEQYPLEYYVFNESYSQALAGVEDMPLALDVFSELYGIYPFHTEKYGMTQLGYYGAIENQTNTIINNMSTGYFMTSVHELAHMWFGDMITCADWHHGWLNEGFATYSEALYVEAQQGHQAYLNTIANEEYYQGGSLYVENIQDTFNIFQPLIYSKGAYVLHMLRGVLGDDLFFEGIKNYATDPELMYGRATSEDLQQVMENTSGNDLGFFFDEWIYDEYYPIYEYNFESDAGSGIAYISLKQTQEDLGRRPFFEMPVQMKLFLQDGSDTTVTLWNDLKVQTFEIPIEQQITFVQFDPEGWLLDQNEYNPGLPVGIADSRSDAQISVFPVPAKDQIQIVLPEISSTATATITDFSGRILIKFPPRHGMSTINISELLPGIYFVNIHEESGDHHIKFIKE